MSHRAHFDALIRVEWKKNIFFKVRCNFWETRVLKFDNIHISCFHPKINFKFIFKNQLSIENFSDLKDCIPNIPQSCVNYVNSCGQYTFIQNGETSCHLARRIDQIKYCFMLSCFCKHRIKTESLVLIERIHCATKSNV